MEDRTYHLFFGPRAANFFIGVVAPGSPRPTIVTVLEKSQFENDRGMLRAEALWAAAHRALPAADFERWESAFEWAAQRMDRRQLKLHIRWQGTEGLQREIEMPMPPMSNGHLAGGNLGKLMVDDVFLGHVNADLSAHLGDAAPEALSCILAFEITYRSNVVLDMLEYGGPEFLARFKSRRLVRNSLKLFVTFAHDMKLHQFQKTRPSIPAEFVFENMLPNLRHNDAFVASVRHHIAKLVPPQDLLQALASVSELQIHIGDRCIDLITSDDRSAVQRLVEMA
jgi:hypothetical protein